ncbi:CGNR zinc finger domain-containing protein [Actinoplanes sp. TBRC 11911]|uniref:CGNR zinc finger domain-containing protein n=1 Tax=Actinoplanes sp. TBRC 11911 TaxID=2729386 RepID=UPI00145F0504|nr:CGNR zinc finger domain-containing protein [Actinoplanes sp. TBRC 11911]NMO50052.1 CGNR zinc finger domain-containing protein [Actinoplanes sp. TBRC 11911]
MVQRPLVGEPLALDLVNTQWLDRSEIVDLFDSPGELPAWLAEHHFAGDAGAVEGPLRQARGALRRILEEPGPAAEDGVNRVLSYGVVRFAIGPHGVREDYDVESDWVPAWRAVKDYLELLSGSADRIRRCAHPACNLYFYDTSRNGTRRWCSMDGCGSRSKAARHYQRRRGAAGAPASPPRR